MEGIASNSPEINRFVACHSDLDVNNVMDISIANLNKKRKFQSELLNLQRHVCVDQMLEYDDSSDLSTKKVKSCSYVGGGESDLSSAEDRYGFNGGACTCPPDGTKICILHSKMPSTLETLTSSDDCDGASSEINPYSVETWSLIKSCSSKSEPTSSGEEVYCHGLQPCHGHILAFGSYANCSNLECQKDGLEHCPDNELDSLHCSDAVAPTYVLSSGRWPVYRDTKQDSRKLTIDKEFEDYFSMLML